MKNKIPCPFCGEEIDEDAKSCWYCGSDRETGWSNSSYNDSFGPDDGFDYDETLEEEFGMESNGTKIKNRKATYLKVASAFLLILFFLFILKGLL